VGAPEDLRPNEWWISGLIVHCPQSVVRLQPSRQGQTAATTGCGALSPSGRC
jgi:hypothetical protein